MGIDVSHHNDMIDWQKVLKAGHSFAWIKATDGRGYSDPMFANNWQEAGKAGVRRGAYHYLRSGQGGEFQANRLIAAVSSVGGLTPNDLGYALDFEDRDGIAKLGIDPHAAVQEAIVFLERVKTMGHRNPCIYLDGDMALLDVNKRFGAYHLWLADWNLHDKPTIPRQWSDWTFWQWSEKGTVDGVPGASSVDLDRFRFGFDGLAAWVSRTIL